MDHECKAMGDQNGPRVQSSGRPKWTTSAKQWETKMDRECKAQWETKMDHEGPPAPAEHITAHTCASPRLN